MKPVKIIVAHSSNGVIGNGLKMPGWSLTDDFLKNFVPKTKGCPVIMGRKTAQSLEKPLPGRTNIVISRNPIIEFRLPEGFIVVPNIWSAMELANEAPGDTVWIIGGGEIYALAIENLVISELHITKVGGSFVGDIKFPDFKEQLYCILSRTSFSKRTSFEKDRGNSHNFVVEVHKLL